MVAVDEVLSEVNIRDIDRLESAFKRVMPEIEPIKKD